MEIQSTCEMMLVVKNQACLKLTVRSYSLLLKLQVNVYPALSNKSHPCDISLKLRRDEIVNNGNKNY